MFSPPPLFHFSPNWKLVCHKANATKFSLDSRQRKKQHTERLEEEKKIHSAVIQDLEDKLNAMSMQEEQMHQRIENLIRERDFIAHKAETLQMEKEDIVREHTIETRELRKKNAYLESQTQKMQEALDRAPMAHAPSSSGFSDTFNLDSDFDFGTEYWNDPMSMPSSDIAPIKSEKIQPRDAEKPAAAPGLLLIVSLLHTFVYLVLTLIYFVASFVWCICCFFQDICSLAATNSQAVAICFGRCFEQYLPGCGCCSNRSWPC